MPRHLLRWPQHLHGSRFLLLAPTQSRMIQSHSRSAIVRYTDYEVHAPSQALDRAKTIAAAEGDPPEPNERLRAIRRPPGARCSRTMLGA